MTITVGEGCRSVFRHTGTTIAVADRGADSGRFPKHFAIRSIKRVDRPIAGRFPKAVNRATNYERGNRTSAPIGNIPSLRSIDEGKRHQAIVDPGATVMAVVNTQQAFGCAKRLQGLAHVDGV